MSKVKIFYFSGSGNTELIAEHTKKVFIKHNYDCELFRMEDVKNIELEDVDLLGLMFPVALQSTYPNVWKFIESLPKKKMKVFMIDTLEKYSGGIVGPMKKVLTRKNYICIGAIEVKMHSSMNTKEYDIDLREKSIQKALIRTEEFVRSLINGTSKWRRIPILSDGMRLISMNRKIWTSISKNKGVEEVLCIGCSLCVRKCPVDAIRLDDVIKINHDQCISCMRCLHVCPKEAIRFKGKKLIK